jgi:hypothetical protein
MSPSNPELPVTVRQVRSDNTQSLSDYEPAKAVNTDADQ